METQPEAESERLDDRVALDYLGDSESRAQSVTADVSLLAVSQPETPEAPLHLNVTPLIYLAFVLFGCAFLVPWNSFIAAIDYFQLVYPDQKVEFDLSVSYMAPNVLGLIAGLFFGPKFSLNIRILPGFLVYLGVLTLAPFVGALSLTYPILIILLALAGLADAVVQTGGQGYAGMVGPSLPQAIQTGLGVSGILASGLRILTKLMLPNTKEGLERSAVFYFVLSDLIVIAGIVIYIWSRRTPEVAAEMARHASHHTKSLEIDPMDESWRSTLSVSVVPLALKIWRPLAIIAFNFFMSMTLFPGTLAQITSEKSELNSAFWFPVITIFLFNLSDFVGKLLPKWERFTHQKIDSKLVYILGISRVIFAPILLTAATNVWKSDFVTVLIVLAFGVTNGFVGSFFIVYSNSIVSPSERELTTLLGNTSIVSGLMLGSLSSMSIKHIFFV